MHGWYQINQHPICCLRPSPFRMGKLPSSGCVQQTNYPPSPGRRCVLSLWSDIDREVKGQQGRKKQERAFCISVSCTIKLLVALRVLSCMLLFTNTEYTLSGVCFLSGPLCAEFLPRHIFMMAKSPQQKNFS